VQIDPGAKARPDLLTTPYQHPWYICNASGCLLTPEVLLVRTCL